MDNGELVDWMKRAGIVRTGDFRLASGKGSKYYVDAKRALLDPVGLPLVARHVYAYLCEHYDACPLRVGGPELGVVPLVGALVMVSDFARPPGPCVSGFVVRKYDRTRGTRKTVEGVDPVAEGTVATECVLVEDVATTGGSLVHCINLLKSIGHVVRRAVVVVDRQEGAKEALLAAGVDLHSLVTAQELLDISAAVV